MRPLSSNPSRDAGPTCRVRRANAEEPRGIRALSGQYSIRCRPRPKGRNLRRRPPARPDQSLIAAALTGIVTSENHLVGDGGKLLTAFARKAKIPFHVVPSPGKPTLEAPHLHINNVNAYHSRLKQWLNRFNGVATKNPPNHLGQRRALDAWGQPLDPSQGILGAIGAGPSQYLTRKEPRMGCR